MLFYGLIQENQRLCHCFCPISSSRKYAKTQLFAGLGGETVARKDKDSPHGTHGLVEGKDTLVEN